jgi:hypothetical protein
MTIASSSSPNAIRIGIFIVPYENAKELVLVVETNNDNNFKCKKRKSGDFEDEQHQNDIQHKPINMRIHYHDIHCNSLPIPIPKPTTIRNDNPYASPNSSRNDA